MGNDGNDDNDGNDVNVMVMMRDGNDESAVNQNYYKYCTLNNTCFDVFSSSTAKFIRKLIKFTLTTLNSCYLRADGNDATKMYEIELLAKNRNLDEKIRENKPCC